MDSTTTGIEIKLFTNEESLWDRYAHNSPEASLYHLIGWKRVIERTFGHTTYYLYALQNDHIVGLAPFVFLKSFVFGKFIVSLPFLNYGGIAANSEEIRKLLLEKAIRIAQQEGAAHIELRHLENYGLGLEPANKLLPNGVRISLTASAFGCGAIKPDFRNRTVLREQFV